MICRQLFDRASCTYTYVLADPVTRDAVIIDPVFELVDRDAALLRELQLNLRYSLDTHCHADHVTGSWLLKEQLGCDIVLSKRVDAQNVDRAVDHGDRIRIGDYVLLVRATPGHTAGCVTYVTGDEQRAFTGDALLIRGAGRTDFQEGSSQRLYRSIQDQIFTLPSKCVLYPAHDYLGRTSSTVEEEKRFNPRIGGGADERDFVGYMDNLGLPHPRHIDVALPANLKSGRPDEPLERDEWAPLTYTFGGVVEVDPEWVATHRGDVTILDVRSEPELLEGLGSIKDCLCVPLGNLRDSVEKIPAGKPIITVCHAGKRSAMAAKILRDAGRPQVANLAGGMVRWRLLALPIA